MKCVRWIVAAVLATFGNMPVLADSAARTWTGCYAGVHAGGTWGMVDHKATGFPVDPSYQNDVSFRSATAGAHAGCNYQSGSLVLGIEGDLSWASVDEGAVAYINEDTERRQLWRDRFDWFATLRGHIGYARGPWHAFATGRIRVFRSEARL